MREILFRGKRLDNGKWVEGFLLYNEEQNEAYIATNFDDKVVYFIAVDPESTGQYTGSKDQNGTKIFEGDILRFSYTGKNHGVEGVAVVEFENGKFGVKWGWHKEFVPLDGFANTTIEVIGNIHDNPELLKGE